MDTYGFSYQPPQLYQPASAQAQNASHSQMMPSYLMPESAAAIPSRHSAAAQQSYEHNRNRIPGLGLGLQATPSQSPSLPNPSRINGTPPRPVPAQHIYASRDEQTEKGGLPESSQDPAQSEFEEGEIDEDDLDDIYEPGELPEVVADVSRPRRLESATGGQDEDLVSFHPARERSRSYSPWLSPDEIQSVATQIPPPAQEPPMETTRKVDDVASIGLTTLKNAHEVPNSIFEAKRKARDAVIRLQHLHVRFQDYIREGIDERILQDLFKEVGFEMCTARPAFAASDTAHVTARDRSESQAQKEPVSTSQSTKEPSEISPQELNDKSESRKDRIARLLAAKKSKAPVAVDKPAAVQTTQISKEPTSNHLAEKSKLLRQKMEALKQKSREALASKKSHQDMPTTASSAPSRSGESFSSRTNPDAQVEKTNLKSSNAEQASTTEIASESTHISSNLPTVSVVDTRELKPHQKRPGSTDLTASQQPSKRPFGQNRESRPFLIDVSDDDDDAEMELDSPSRQSANIQRSDTPIGKVAQLRPGLTRPECDSGGNLYSTGRLSGSPGPKGATGGTDDLETMNKQIELMKRRIAEAEARQKAKESGQNSPKHSSKQPRVDPAVSLEPQSMPSPFNGGSDYAAIEQLLLDVQQSQTSPGRLGGPPNHPSLGRRSCSRTASERLSAIEAHRRERLLRLQNLQAQVASLEKEIRENLEEEQRLRSEEAADPDSAVADGAPLHDIQIPHARVSESSEQDANRKSFPASTLGTSQERSSIPDDGRDHSLPTDPESLKSDGSSRGDSCERGQGDVKQHVEESSVESPVATDTSEKHSGPSLKDSDGEVTAADINSPVRNPGESAITFQQAASSGFASVAERAALESTLSKDAVLAKPDQSMTSDACTPPEAEIERLESDNGVSELSRPGETRQGELPNISNASPRDAVELASATQHMAEANKESTSLARDAPLAETDANVSQPNSGFQTYFSPLQYFRAYRFHPEFSRSIPGGLRSLTYSNSIDVKKPFCPDEVAGDACPRGAECDFQHFENIQTPDDQILLQLGSYTTQDGDHREEFISGLRSLLADLRDRKIKDFATIGQAIVDFRSQFRQDKSKILPLGNISI